MDDPLWELLLEMENIEDEKNTVLIPLLVDDPLWAHSERVQSSLKSVLIPLLVDDPLWGLYWSYVY